MPRLTVLSLLVFAPKKNETHRRKRIDGQAEQLMMLINDTYAVTKILVFNRYG